MTLSSHSKDPVVELQSPLSVAEDVGTVDVCAILTANVTSDLVVSLFTSDATGKITLHYTINNFLLHKTNYMVIVWYLITILCLFIKH